MRAMGWKMSSLLLLGIGLFLWLVKGPIVAAWMSEQLKVPVSIGWISIGPFESSVRDFTIDNPKGFQNRHAFHAERMAMGYRLKEFWGAPETIDSIEMDHVTLSIEFINPLGTKNNWTEIAEAIGERKRKKKEVLVRQLTLTDVTIEIRGLGLSGVQTKKVERFEISDISSDEGFPTEEMISQVFGGMGLHQYVQEVFLPFEMF
jgi:hypothetical protein